MFLAHPVPKHGWIAGLEQEDQQQVAIFPHRRDTHGLSVRAQLEAAVRILCHVDGALAATKYRLADAFEGPPYRFGLQRIRSPLKGDLERRGILRVLLQPDVSV